ncbi:hypothetical protein Daesc_006053 [Daldinia eschscholtzii]|uniref:Acyltransferase C-terminal domain-containing protein n=1 Tax=Daldinia eschscholtzii TaxID=292717 RepID=A0AAX6MH86_9PEZI
MNAAELRRHSPSLDHVSKPKPTTGAPGPTLDSNTAHPAGKAKYGRFRAFLRAVSVFVYFASGCLTIHATQIIGAPLYYANRDLYYAYMSLTKASFGLLITTMTQWWAPTVIRISGDASVAGQLNLTPDGRIECAFPERMVMIANHQVWHWINDPRRQTLRKLKTRHTGTNLSSNGRNKSAQWAAKMGLRDMEHLMLPRSTGMFFCLNELRGTVDYVYDCTVAYEGVPRGKYGENYFTLSSTYFQGRPPKSVNFYWRRFALADIPLDSQEEFDKWLRERWYEKDALLEQYVSTGRFPANAAGIKGHIETEVRTQYWWEFIKIFVMLGSFGLIFSFFLRTFRALARG